MTARADPGAAPAEDPQARHQSPQNNRTGLLRLGLRLRMFLFFAALALGAAAAVILGLTFAYTRLDRPELLAAFVQGGTVAGFGTLGLIAWVWFLFDTHVARPIDLLAGDLRARAHADVSPRTRAAIARYLGDLAPAADAAAQSLSETRSALAEAVARETQRLADEKARLEALLSDVDAGVVLCSGAHQIVFYNGPAIGLLGVDPSPSGGLGLDRHLFDYLREGPVRHAHERLTAGSETDPAPEGVSDILCATTGAARILAMRMRLLPAQDAGPSGYVLTLRDVTADLAQHARTEAFLTEIFDRVRRPAANLVTLMAALTDPAEEASRADAGLDGAIRSEVGQLSRAVTDLAARHDAVRAEAWPLALTRASDLVDGIRARIEAGGGTASTEAAPLLLRCNGFEIVALIAGLAEAIAAETGNPAFRLSIDEDDGAAMLRLVWSGPGLALVTLQGWLGAPLEPGLTDVTRAGVLASHATDAWPEAMGQGDQALCLPLPLARRAGPRPAPIPRRVVYDFDLLTRAQADRLADRTLRDLTYVVFDTETTGLLPGQGDEIVQIAAVRIVNGRRVEGEILDTLVNPGRPIPPGATAVHGITDAMVTEAPPATEALRSFHRFAQGAVLVAHNAPFDLAFLQRSEAALGLRFDMAVLDTVLLSAVVYGQHDSHSLDALTHRLGIAIPEEARHTALG
ncbi:MAG: DNA polymerase III subunit epsilon, partial [Rubellimicrobium sp.]|nr:DNA polymerase III subunit epsilon [Rubellimicrobium sp.]